MLYNKIPLRVVHSVIEIRYCDLHPPVLLVIEFDMPMDSDRTHMAGALDQRCITRFSWT